MEKKPQSESYIIKEAESIIEAYVRQREENEVHKYREKYERLKILSIAMGVVGSLGILITTMM